MFCRQVKNVSSGSSPAPARITFLLLFNYHIIPSDLSNDILSLFADNLESKDLISMTMASRFQRSLEARIHKLALTYSCRGGKSVLVWAVINERGAIFRSLVERGATLSIQDGDENMVLHHLADRSSTHLVCLLLEKHIDVSVQNKKGCLKTLNLKGTSAIFT